jgi:hypothetical protein
VKYLALRLTGISFPDRLVDTVTAVCYFLALALSLYVNLGKKKMRKEKVKKPGKKRRRKGEEEDELQQ